MATYAIGDVQGCFDALQDLLEKIRFDPSTDTLWFCGDLVNRGPQSLKTLRFIHDLGDRAVTVLGNHDLHCLAAFYNQTPCSAQDTLTEILNSSDGAELCDWLRKQPLIHCDEQFNCALVHAGIYPWWNLQQAQSYAAEVESILQSDEIKNFFTHMYGDKPTHWDESLGGWERLRFITNCFTRMRLCDNAGNLLFDYKGKAEGAPADYQPWFEIEKRKAEQSTILFGHWAALECQVGDANVIALDSGCVWGSKLTTVCLESRERFEVECIDV